MSDLLAFGRKPRPDWLVAETLGALLRPGDARQVPLEMPKQAGGWHERRSAIHHAPK